MKKNINTFSEKSYLSLFTRFLRYGLLAWGGPIGQLALIEREMVYEKKLISLSYFNHLIAIYQAVPGPETHEICVHLGTQAKGLFGGLLAGLGFMLPGFLLMLFFSWLYVLYGITPLVSHVLIGIKPAVIAWIAVGGFQLGRGILTNIWLFIIAIAAFFAEILNIHFIIIFLVSGIVYSLFSTQQFSCLLSLIGSFIYRYKWLIIFALTIFLIIMTYTLLSINQLTLEQNMQASYLSIFLLGLKSGGLSFGSVYTIFSIIKTGAINNHWLTQSQFIDGLALAGSLPAPFIIITTFVGYIAHGLTGAVIITLGTFLPAFLIPMFFHEQLTYIANNKRIRIFLDGITAGVAGLIAADVLDILRQVIISKLTLFIVIASLLFIQVYKSPYAIIWIVLLGGILGVFFAHY